VFYRLQLLKDFRPKTSNQHPAKKERYNIQMAGMLKVTLVKSMIGRPEKHRKVLRGMGLTKLNRTVELQDTPSIRGMINAVSHLVKAEEKINEAK
jgi:large subunit ribosomal protein L30